LFGVEDTLSHRLFETGDDLAIHAAVISRSGLAEFFMKLIGDSPEGDLGHVWCSDVVLFE